MENTIMENFMGWGLVILIILIVCINTYRSRTKHSESNKGLKDYDEDTLVKAEEIEVNDNNIDNSEEIVAVIAAAVAASLSNSTHNIVVKSIKRVDNISPVWNTTGRYEQISSRF